MRSASELINAAYGGHRGKNFMTPEWLGDYHLPWGAVELTRGRGLAGEPIFGVTVVGKEGEGAKRLPKLSRLAFSRKAALTYIKRLGHYATAEEAEKGEGK